MIACSIPLSVVFAIVLMYFTGISLNIISLSGLALGVGMLVDNSIVVIENIYRLRNQGLSIRKAAVEGAGQVAGAILHPRSQRSVCLRRSFYGGYHKAAVCGYCTHDRLYVSGKSDCGADVCTDDGIRCAEEYQGNQTSVV